MNSKPETTYERARRLANFSLWSIHIQCRRLRSSEPEDVTFAVRKWVDFHFLIVGLTRLRRVADLAARIPAIRHQLSTALQEFDNALPQLRKLRNVAEHIDEYANDQGRDLSIDRRSLEVSSLSMDGATLEWLGYKLNCDEALCVSKTLFTAIKEASAAFSQGAAVGEYKASARGQA